MPEEQIQKVIKTLDEVFAREIKDAENRAEEAHAMNQSFYYGRLSGIQMLNNMVGSAVIRTLRDM